MPTKLESWSERKFKDYVETQGCFCLKLSIIGWAGWPDRMILCPGGWIMFVEMKREKKDAQPHQAFIHKILKELNFHVVVCDSFEKAKKEFDTFIQTP